MLRPVMILPDLHWPNHDPEALECVMHAHRLIKPERTVILGDWLDADQFKTHARKSLSEEKSESWLADLAGVKGLVKRLLKHTKQVVFIEGNHENRVERQACESGPLRSVFEAISPAHVIGGMRDVHWVPYMAPALGHYKIAPSLWAIHGWSVSKNAAAAHLAAVSSFSIWHGHTHRAQMTTRKDPRTGRTLTAMSPGCLCVLQPIWVGANPTDWSQGFGLSYVDQDVDEHWSFVCQIDRGVTVLPNGRRVSA